MSRHDNRPRVRGSALAAAFVLATVASLAHAGEFTAKVIAVLDGDTVIVLRGAQKTRVRLANIDAPEKAQEGGAAATQSLAEMVLKKQVHIATQAVDAYGRTVGTLTVGGQNVNEEQVRRGMAWEYSHYHGNQTYVALQREAQQARRGLWGQADPMPPWQWRKLHPEGGAGRAPKSGCGAKRYCSQMDSCAEAMYYLQHCGVASLDANHDGVPCEALCAAAK